MISVIGGTNVIKMNNLGADYEYTNVVDEVFDHLPSSSPYLVVDLGEMDFINSMGINFLLRILKKSNELGGSIAIAGANDKVRSVLNTTQLYDLFNPYDTVEEAINS